jgi:hypothetical protein
MQPLHEKDGVQQLFIYNVAQMLMGDPPPAAGLS